MKRNSKLEGIVIRNYRIQDFHKGAVIFSPDTGIFHAIVYGGYKGKSKLGPSVQPLCRGKFDVYHDPVKKSNKILEYESFAVYEDIKSDLKKYFTALSWLEISVKSHGGGESRSDFYSLLSAALDTLELLPEALLDRLAVQFLLRTAILLGGNLNPNECGLCGKKIASEEPLYYSRADACFSCSNCSGIQAQAALISAGIKKYIEYSLKNSLETSLNAVIDNNLLKYFKSLLYNIIEEYLEENLLTLKTGKDYLF
ncbi:MAG: DNA repair protein RecO [Spirochaetes bacterium]|nr:DNA repair protein RecO [Spirochaetota bacterium]